MEGSKLLDATQFHVEDAVQPDISHLQLVCTAEPKAMAWGFGQFHGVTVLCPYSADQARILQPSRSFPIAGLALSRPKGEMINDLIRHHL